MTAFYMWRLMNMTFYGKSRVAPEVRHTHESPKSMTVPLIGAGGGQRVGGLAGDAEAVEPAGAASGRSSCGWSRRSRAAAHEAVHEGAHHDASIEWILMGAFGGGRA